MISTNAVSEGVSRLAAQIDRDLARRLKSPVTIDFLQVSSYGKGKRTSGNVRMVRDLSIDVAGKHVLIVEDIVDTGRTLGKILAILRTRNPASLKVCALLRKRIPRKEEIAVDYLGFEIDDRFVVGYGLDFAEAYRNLPYIAALEERGDEP